VVGIFGFLLAVMASLGQDHASIRATVLDDKDEPARDAVVEAEPMGVMLAIAVRWCKSDERGSCTISLGDLGRYSVSASTVEVGYPMQHFSFYAAQNSKPLFPRSNQPRALLCTWAKRRES
jgi:hypothetical protein